MSWFDWYSVIGTTITIGAFAITIHQIAQTKVVVREAKEYAALAERAANKAVAELRRFEAVVDFSAVISILHEVRRLQRDHVWAALPERYSEARSLLISAREAAKQLNETQKSKIQNAIVNFRELENLVQSFSPDYEKIPANDMIKQLLSDIDDIVEIFHQVRLSNEAENVK